MNLIIKEIEAKDKPEIASIIRGVMEEFNANPETTNLGDPTLNTIFENYQADRAVY